MADGRVEALLRLLQQALLEPVVLAALVREQDDLVGREGLEGVVEGQQWVRLAGVAGGVHSLLVHALHGLLLHGFRPADRLVGVGGPETDAVIERRRHHHHLGALGAVTHHLAQGIPGYRLGNEGKDLLRHGGFLPRGWRRYAAAAPAAASLSRERRSSRDTCICEMPTTSAISAWVRSSSKRNRRISRSRAGSATIVPRSTSPISTSS